MNTNLHPKVVAATLGGAATAVLVFVLSHFAHVEIPADVAASVTTLASFGFGYLTPA